MRLLLPRKSLRLVLRWTERTLFACAAMFLGYCAFVVVDTWRFQHRETRNLDRQLQRPVSLLPESLPPNVGSDGLIGRIAIPRLGLSAVVIEGSTALILRRAVGHIVGTGFAGQAGNIGLAAHRDTFFRPLRNIKLDDIVILTTLRGEYRYSVLSTRVVSPSDVAVLNPDGREILTLVTCYPFYFVGPAPQRFIVRAERLVNGQ
jgi:sortase A